MRVSLFDVFNEFSSSIKEINRIIWKGLSNIYYWEKLSFWNFQFSPKDNFKKRPNTLTLKSKKIQGTFGGTFILALSSSAIFGLQNCVSDFFCIVLFEGIKGFYQSFLGNEVDFRDIN